MSFILDALKKAESERGRASGPVLVDVRIAPPRRRLPLWAWVLGGVLLANLAVLAWLLLPARAGHEVEVATSPAAQASTVAPSRVQSQSQSPATGTALLEPPPAHIALQPTALPPPSLPSTQPQVAVAPLPRAPATAALNTPPADVDKLPTLRQLQASGVTLPPLQLNMHVYDPTPAQRFVLLNGARLAEGETTADGIKVEAITERGVVLDAHGQRFLLTIGG